MNQKRIRLLLVDPQNDFHDYPVSEGQREVPALPVKNAMGDLERLVKFILTNAGRIDEIQVTLDSHGAYDIGHASWWLNRENDEPQPFILITAEDVLSGIWKARDPAMQAWTEYYIRRIGSSMVWPNHCIVGTWGHNIPGSLLSALQAWSVDKGRAIDYVWKGLNPKTEHYSAVQAVVPVPEDLGTVTNYGMVDAVMKADITYVAGQALSHCVASTVTDIIAAHPGAAKKMALLMDCTSPVEGFEHQADEFVANAMGKGMQVKLSQDGVEV